MTTATAKSRLLPTLVIAVAATIVGLWGWGLHEALTDPPAQPEFVFIIAGLVAVAVSLRLRLWVFLIALAGYHLAAYYLLPAAASENFAYGAQVGILAAVAFMAGLAVRDGIKEDALEDSEVVHVPPCPMAGFVAEEHQEVFQLGEDDEPEHLLIGLCGYAGAGKDTAAKALLWNGWEHASFAAKLKDFALKVNPLISVHPGMPGYASIVGTGGTDLTPKHVVHVRYADYLDLVGAEQAKTNPEVRQLQQRIGTDAGRKVLGDNVWVDAAMDDLPAGKNVVFTDVRFPNEAAAIQDAGGYVIRISRPGHGPVNNHPSETSLDTYPIDAVVTNDDTMAVLGRRLAERVEQLKSRELATW